MDALLVLSYPPELVDKAVKEHVERNMNYSGRVNIEYTHKRTLRKVSAEVSLLDPLESPKLSEAKCEQIAEEPASVESEMSTTETSIPEEIEEPAGDDPVQVVEEVTGTKSLFD